jgi:hypothetical protein
MPATSRTLLCACLGAVTALSFAACSTAENEADRAFGEPGDAASSLDGGAARDTSPGDEAADDTNLDAHADAGAPDDVSADVAAEDTAADSDGNADTRDAQAGSDPDTGEPDVSDVGADAREVDVTEPVDDDLPFGPAPTLAEVLAYLEADPEAAVRAIANSRGWPMPIAGGTLFVSLDVSLPEIAGDFVGWDVTPMTAAADFYWYSHPDVRPGQRYKFTDGDRYVADPWSRALEWDEFGAMSLTVPTYAHVQRYFELGDGVVLARDLHVWVPAETITHVLYAHDGQNLFGPGSTFGSWNMEQAAPPGMLIVGIFNTSQRFADYTPVTDRVGEDEVGGAADAYLRFIDSTVRPLVRRNYGEPGPVGVLGSSLGGVVSLYAALAQPGEWDFAASLSGALSWGSRRVSNETLHAHAAGLAASGTVIYLDSGGGAEACVDTDGDGVLDDDPTERDDYCVTIQLRDQLAAAGMEFSSTLWHWWEPDAAHNETAWAARVSRPLTVFAAMR